MTERPPRPTLKQRFSPHPPSSPRNAFQRFNRAKTDSGWPLLLANFAIFAGLAGYGLRAAASGSTLFTVLSVTFVLGVLRTGHVMVCVARGMTGLTADGAPVPAVRRDDPDQRPRLF